MAALEWTVNRVEAFLNKANKKMHINSKIKKKKYR